MRVLCVAAVLVACVLAQEADNSTVSSPEAAVMAQVLSEQAITRQYVETLMKLQRAQYEIQAAKYLLEDIQAGGQNVKNLDTFMYDDNQYDDVGIYGDDYVNDDYYYGDDDVAFDAGYGGRFDPDYVADDESDSGHADPRDARYAFLEEEGWEGFAAPAANMYGANPYAATNPFGAYGSAYDAPQPAGPFANEAPSYDNQWESGPTSHAAKRIMFAYNLYYSVKYRTITTILKSADVQNEFWQDRAMQLYVQMAGESVPANILQMVFVKLYRTNLETLKLSLAFQTISHHISWLEDELDVWGSVQTENDLTVGAVLTDQEDDLLRDRMFAFTAYNSFAQLDFQTFYFDLYLESVLGGGSLGGSFGAAATPAGTTAMLEEESTAKPFTDILATGSFGAGVNSQPYLFLKMYRFYYLLFQMYTANSGLNAVTADMHAYGMLHDDTSLNDELGNSVSNMGDSMMTQYATNMMYSAQMEYISSLYELFLLFAPVLGGSLGGSLGSLGASLGSI